MQLSVYNPPEYNNQSKLDYTIFLAGSIEQGTASQWQDRLITDLSQVNWPKQVGIFNPRRNTWLTEWNDTFDHPELIEQINWELYHLTRTHCVAFNFCAQTLSPVSLLELGLITMRQAMTQNSANQIDLVIHIEKGYLRTENIIQSLKYLQDVYPQTQIRVIIDDYPKFLSHLKNLIYA